MGEGQVKLDFWIGGGMPSIGFVWSDDERGVVEKLLHGEWISDEKLLHEYDRS